MVEHLLSLQVAGVVADLLALSGENILGRPSSSPSTSSADCHRSYLERVFKHCMWHFSSSINHRRPLVSAATNVMKRKEEIASRSIKHYEDLWRDLISKEAKAFQTDYVNQRLAR